MKENPVECLNYDDSTEGNDRSQIVNIVKCGVKNIA